jgi:hypothetical protein
MNSIKLMSKLNGMIKWIKLLNYINDL